MNIRELVRPSGLEHAYTLLQDADNAIIAGLTNLKLSQRKIGIAIDLSEMGLDYIRESQEYLEIGAMTTMREIEQSTLCRNLFSGALVRALEHVGGVQLRSHITVGGTVFLRNGFSDLITVLLALDCQVSFFRKGIMPIGDFLEQGIRKDIITGIRIPIRDVRCALEELRKSYTDFPLLNAAAAKSGPDIRIAVGARPSWAQLAPKAMLALSGGCTAREAGIIAGEELNFGDNLHAGAWYRKKLCDVLVTRVVEKVV